MKYGILSDVHGNLEALETALAYLKAEMVTEYLCLGDIVGYGANPEECLTLIRELRGAVVAGNHDHGVAGRTSIRSFNEHARKALLWTGRQLSADSTSFLGSLPLVEIAHGLRLVHASPSSPRDWEYVETWSDIKSELASYSEPICLIGHSHIPFAAKQHRYKADPQRILEPEFEIDCDDTRLLVNVGSVGQPRDGDNRACVVTYDVNSKRMEFHRLDYDVAAAQRKILAAGLPEALAWRLAEGR
jgi:predicted phosphodiesterase